MAPTTTSSNLARRAAASRADVATAATADSQDNLARSAPTLAETLQTSQIRWRLHAGWAQRLATTDDRFGHWLADGRATLVKHGTNRLVYRVDRGDEPLYVKRYRHRRGLARLAPLLRGSPARREWNKALELSRRGIPTAMPVALGEDLRAGIPSDSLLVTREIPASQSLDQFLQDELPRWTATEQRATRRWLACSLARLVAATHRAGVRHDDLHAGNILVNLAAARRPRTQRRSGVDELTADRVTNEAATTELQVPPLFLIDLPGVSFGRPLGRRASLTSLVMLAAGLFEHSTSREQWRCWRTYLASRPDLSLDEPRAVAQSIVARVLTYQRALARSRDRRALATNRDFRRINIGPTICHATQELSPDVLAMALRAIEAGESETIAEVVIESCARGATADVEKVSGTFSSARDGRPSVEREKVPDTFSPPAPGSEATSRAPRLVVHRVPAGRWPWNWLEHPARRAWRLAQALASRDIATERPLASLVPRWFAPWRDGYLVFAPATPLAEVLDETLASLEQGDARDARRLAEACGAALGKMHRWRVSCPLSIATFAVRRKCDAFEIVLTDWAQAQLPRWATTRQAERRALRDLAALRGELRKGSLAAEKVSGTFSRSTDGRPSRAEEKVPDTFSVALGATAGLPSSARSDAELTDDLAASTVAGRFRTSPPLRISRTWLARALRAYVAVQLREPAAWRELWRHLAE